MRAGVGCQLREEKSPHPDRLRGACHRAALRADPLARRLTVYHVQSEAREGELLLQTQVFVRGRCIGKRASSYADKAASFSTCFRPALVSW